MKEFRCAGIKKESQNRKRQEGEGTTVDFYFLLPMQLATLRSSKFSFHFWTLKITKQLRKTNAIAVIVVIMNAIDVILYAMLFWQYFCLTTVGIISPDYY